MTKKVIRFTPDQLGYVDRGDVKWQRLTISHHTELLTQMTTEEDWDISAEPKQSLAEISEYVYEAYHRKSPIAIQANIVQNGSYLIDAYCMVSGFLEEHIFLLLKEGRMISTTLEDIRHIEFINPRLWD